MQISILGIDWGGFKSKLALLANNRINFIMYVFPYYITVSEKTVINNDWSKVSYTVSA